MPTAWSWSQCHTVNRVYCTRPTACIQSTCCGLPSRAIDAPAWPGNRSCSSFRYASLTDIRRVQRSRGWIVRYPCVRQTMSGSALKEEKPPPPYTFVHSANDRPSDGSSQVNCLSDVTCWVIRERFIRIMWSDLWVNRSYCTAWCWS